MSDNDYRTDQEKDQSSESPQSASPADSGTTPKEGSFEPSQYGTPTPPPSGSPLPPSGKDTKGLPLQETYATPHAPHGTMPEQSPYGSPPAPPSGALNQTTHGNASQQAQGEAPSQSYYGSPAEAPYGFPNEIPHGAHSQAPYTPEQQPTGSPGQTPYGAPAQPPYNTGAQAPYGKAPQNTPYGYQQNTYQQNPYGNELSEKGKGLGIAALVLGIIALLCSCIPFFNYFSYPFAFVGLILGIVSVVKARGGRGPKGFGIAGIVCSAAGLVIATVMSFLLGLFFYAAPESSSVTPEQNVFAEERDVLPSESPGAVTRTEDDVAFVSVSEDLKDEGDGLYWIYVTMKNMSVETIEYVMIEFPVYDQAGKDIGTAIGFAFDVPPGEFEVEALAVTGGEIPSLLHDTEVKVTFG